MTKKPQTTLSQEERAWLHCLLRAERYGMQGKVSKPQAKGRKVRMRPPPRTPTPALLVSQTLAAMLK